MLITGNRLVVSKPTKQKTIAQNTDAVAATAPKAIANSAPPCGKPFGTAANTSDVPPDGPTTLINKARAATSPPMVKAAVRADAKTRENAHAERVTPRESS